MASTLSRHRVVNPEPSLAISFSAPLLAAVRAGHKTVTRRRLAGCAGLLEEPDRYQLRELDAAGAHFAETATGRHLPAIPYPFGQPGENVLPVAEAPDLLLEITAVRVERVQAITAAGALAEGIRAFDPDPNLAVAPARWGGVEPDPAGGFCWYPDPVTAFAHLLTGFYPRAWERNAWVWVIEFRRLEL